MEYRKVGRGGAGNYYSPADIATASKRAQEDVEAQRPTSSSPPSSLQPSLPSTTSSQAQSQPYKSSGRGGAGNFASGTSVSAEASTSTSDAFSISSTNTQSTTQNPSTDLNVTSHLQPSSTQQTHRTGRGGAGNFLWDESQRASRQAEDEKRKREEGQELKAWEDVETGLKEPEQAHLGP